MMKKKRILICDDDNTQFNLLKDILDNTYDVVRSTDYKNVVEDLEKNKHVHLLILDLGFPGGRYIGHECIPDVITKFPHLKIIIFSDIILRNDRAREAAQIFRKLRSPQISAILSPADKAPIIEFEVNKALGTSQWLKDGELWLLHASDIQFGGEGMNWDAEPLARQIWQMVQTFVQNDPETETEGRRSYPSLAVLTGDLTEHARPCEFDQASRFAQKLSELIEERSSDMTGLIGKHSVIVIPGNHDINWDISFARNLHPKERETPSDSPVEYKNGRENVREDLNFLWRYSWSPFSEIKCGLPEDQSDWAWEPGYLICNLKDELKIIFVCLNSSRWSVDHLEPRALVPQGVWLEIETKLNAVDPDKSAARILLVHHTLAVEAEPKDRLTLKENPDEPKLLINMLSRTCNFSSILTGHIHELVADELNTGSDKRKLVYIGAGTTRSSDRKEYRNPQFNLIKLGNMSDENKFQTLTVYPFHWDGTRFCAHAAWEDGTRAWHPFELKY